MEVSLMQISPPVTVIVLNRNGKDTVEKCLASVLSQDYPHYEVIVIDNASDDDSIVIINRYATRVSKFLANPKNVGYAAGMNLGAANASEESQFLAFVTQDVILPPSWISKMVRHATAEKSIAAVSSRIYDVSKQAYISELKILYPSAYYYIPLDIKYTPLTVGFPAGEAFLIRKSYFRILGMFDPDYFAYYEDGDLGWRTRLSGLKILHASDVEVAHYRSSVFGREPLKYRVYLYEKNRISSCIKNLAVKSLLAFIVSEIFMLCFHCIRALTEKDSDKMGEAYVYALASVARQLPSILEKRKAVQETRRIADKVLFYNSLPRNVMGQPGLVLAYSSKYKKMEFYYLALLNIIAKFLPPM
jgi:GT2 family glycosyltransferase/uncharacterized membrane protein YsdA (DUF1294 family)